MQNIRHPYLVDEICISRLLLEYETHGSLVVAYDFDNTVYDYHNQGHDYTSIIDLLRIAKEFNCYLIVFTAETNIEKVRTFLVDNDIPFNSINENPPFFKSDSRKIYYNILLDDRAGLLSAYKQLQLVFQTIKNRKKHD